MDLDSKTRRPRLPRAVPKGSPSPSAFRMADGWDGSTDATFCDVPYQADTPSMTLGGSSRSVSSPIAFGSENLGESFYEDSAAPTLHCDWNDWFDYRLPSPPLLWDSITWTNPKLDDVNQSFTHSWIAPSYNENTAPGPLINTTENHANPFLSEHRDQRNDVDIEGGSEEDDDDQEEDDDEEDDDEDEWSGQDNELERTVIRALGGDLSLAAHLIPILHKSVFSELTTTVTQKVGPWRRDVLTSSCGLASTESEQTGSRSSNSRPDDPTSTPRKRQRTSNPSTRMTEAEDEDDRNDDEHSDSDDGRRDPKRRRSSPASALVPLLPRLACPFYKRDPGKYSAQSTGDSKSSTSYRACAGPGFKSIQRLKEHLKRKHYPVQCDRCYDIFSGPDRSACVRALEAHRQLDVPCQRKFSSLKEGISDAQWVSLDKKKGKTKIAESSRIEKWFEIWTVLFPTIPQPATPWYENQIQSQTLPPPSRESSAFAELFSAMLDHQVNQQHICFLKGSEDVMKSRIETLVQKAFTLYVGINGPPASTNSSSSMSQTQSLSLLGSSFQPIPTFGTTPSRHNPSSAISTGPSAPWSQAPSLDTAISNVEPPRMSMGPPSMLPLLPQVTQDRTPSQYSSNVLSDISNHCVRFPEIQLSAENGNALHSLQLTGGPEMEFPPARGRQKSI